MEDETAAGEVVRVEDGETLGRVVPDGGLWRPETVFGGLLQAPVATRAEAEAVVRERGLTALAEPWWLRPAGGDWRRGWLLEVRRDRLRVAWTDPKYLLPGSSEWVDPAAWHFSALEPGSTVP